MTSSSSTISAVVCSGATQSHAIRILPGADLVPALLEAAQQAMRMANANSNDSNTSKIAAAQSQPKSQSAFVMTAVGSLTDVTLRMAATDDDSINDNEKNGNDACAEDAAAADGNTNPKPPPPVDDSASNKRRKVETKAASASSSANITKTTTTNNITTTTTTTTHNLRIQTFHKHFEIVSLVGTFSSDGSSKHLHMSLSDSTGAVIGGHLMAGRVYTTLELVLGTIDGVAFTREVDDQTGFLELKVSNSKAP